MKQKIKKGAGIIVIYFVVVLLTVFLTNRVESLESREDFRNQNTSIAFQMK